MGGRLRNKRGKLAERKRECLKLVHSIGRQNPGLNLPEELAAEIGESDTASIKAVGDRIDSLLSAISVYRHAIYRGQVTQMIGDGENGFILLCR